MAAEASDGAQGDMKQLDHRIGYQVEDANDYTYHINDAVAFRDELFGEIEAIVQEYVDGGELPADEYGFGPWDAEIDICKRVDGGEDLEKTVHSVDDLLQLGERGWGWLDYRFDRETANGELAVSIEDYRRVPTKLASGTGGLTTVRDRDKETEYYVRMDLTMPHPVDIAVSDPLHALVEDLQEQAIGMDGSFRLAGRGDRHSQHENAEGIY